jgi:hypothetical protein
MSSCRMLVGRMAVVAPADFLAGAAVIRLRQVRAMSARAFGPLSDRDAAEVVAGRASGVGRGGPASSFIPTPLPTPPLRGLAQRSDVDAGEVFRSHEHQDLEDHL